MSKNSIKQTYKSFVKSSCKIIKSTWKQSCQPEILESFCITYQRVQHLQIWLNIQCVEMPSQHDISILVNPISPLNQLLSRFHHDNIDVRVCTAIAAKVVEWLESVDEIQWNEVTIADTIRGDNCHKIFLS